MIEYSERGIYKMGKIIKNLGELTDVVEVNGGEKYLVSTKDSGDNGTVNILVFKYNNEVDFNKPIIKKSGITFKNAEFHHKKTCSRLEYLLDSVKADDFRRKKEEILSGLHDVTYEMETKQMTSWTNAVKIAKALEYIVENLPIKESEEK